MPLQVGVTGGIGSGKSIVCKVFQCLGIATYDADSRAKYIMTTDGILISAIKKEFGELSYRPDGSLNREYLGKLAFADPERLATLNSIVHPRVGADYERWVSEHGADRYVIKEAALLFETDSYKVLDAVIVVSSPVDLRIKRVLMRDSHRSKQDVEKIIQNQLPEAKTLELADHIIQNDDKHLVIPQVLALHSKFTSGV